MIVSSSRRRFVRIVIALALAVFSGALLAQTSPKKKIPPKPAAPKIKITQMPLAAPGEQIAEKNIEGTVSDAPKDSRIVIYALGDRRYVQPWADHPFTSYSRGKWSAETHGGYEFVVLLVKPSYKPEATTSSVPDKVGGEILAMDRGKPKR